VRVISGATARTMRTLMELVVTEGTGTAAAIPGVVVAGKTGTAELGSTTCSGSDCSAQESPQDTDAWFTAFAPARHPRIAVCVMLVRDGAGGATAAPVARQVLEQGLQSSL
jgi:cell division protein FtsI/penicillin-binding protein 2